MDIPHTTSAVIAQGGTKLSDAAAFTVGDVAVPDLGPHDLLVRVLAVSVNPVDTKIRAGISAGASRVLGWDAAGVVEAVGAEVTSRAVGDEVFYAGDITRPGTNSFLHVVDERIVGRKPSSLSFGEAAALPLTTLTAWESLFDHFRLDATSAGTLLVLSGAWGVGSIMVQLAKTLTSATVIATASRAESHEWAIAQGADHVADHHDLQATVAPLAPEGVQWLFTPYSRGNVPAFAAITAPFGHITAIDDPSGLDILPLKSKSIAWHCELMFTRSMLQTPDMVEQQRILDRTADLVDEGRIRTTLNTTIDGITPEGMREAHSIVASGHAVGKVVVQA